MMKKILKVVVIIILLGSSMYLQAQENLKSNEPYSFSPMINSDGSEYLACLTTDGKTLYFAGTDREGNIGLEDVFVSYFVDGKWSKPVVIEALSKDDSNDAPMSISADGNTIIIFRDGKMYSSNKTVNGWSEPELFDDVNFSPWNCDAVYTADGNAVLFSSGVTSPSIRIDIYVIEKEKDGSWSEPINLGKTINSGAFNRSPFLHSDMKTFYFSSDVEGGYGGLDIYKSTRLSGTSWTEWSEPINLGSEINKDDADWAFKTTTNGNKGIYNVIIDGQADIYEVDLKEEMQAEKVVTITGVITDNSGNPLDAEIAWENLETGKKVGTLKSNPTTGEYIIILPLGKNYGFYVSKEDYYPESDNINLQVNVSEYDIKKDFVLVELSKIIDGDGAIKLNNLFFETSKYDLQLESFPELNRLATFIKSSGNINIKISGHTDDVGSAEYNMNLSLKRAIAVKEYLVAVGCNESQILAVGYGEEKPIESNETEEGRASNRRVEFSVVK